MLQGMAIWSNKEERHFQLTNSIELNFSFKVYLTFLFHFQAASRKSRAGRRDSHTAIEMRCHGMMCDEMMRCEMWDVRRVGERMNVKSAHRCSIVPMAAAVRHTLEYIHAVYIQRQMNLCLMAGLLYYFLSPWPLSSLSLSILSLIIKWHIMWFPTCSLAGDWSGAAWSGETQFPLQPQFKGTPNGRHPGPSVPSDPSAEQSQSESSQLHGMEVIL